MKSLRSSAVVVALVITFVLGNSSSARAQGEVTLVAPGGIRAAIEQLIPGFERKTGHKVKATFGSGGGTKQQVVRGEAFDVPIVQPPSRSWTTSRRPTQRRSTRHRGCNRVAELPVPAGAVRGDLTGKTVMPAMVALRSHIGFQNVAEGTMSKVPALFSVGVVVRTECVDGRRNPARRRQTARSSLGRWRPETL